MCEIVAVDLDSMVAKGLSWALRELVARDREAVEAFLVRHGVRHGDRLAARVRREVKNNLATGSKAGRRGKDR